MELLERFTQGDAEAFEAVFRQFQAEVYRWILRLVRDPAAAEDLTVETFWRVYRARGRFDASREFGPWARRIATNLALDHLRAAPREVPLPQNGLPSQPPAAGGDDQTRAAIQRAFNQLPAKLRAVAILVLIEEQPYADVARSLGVSQAAVKTREFRAVRLLRKKLKRIGIQP